MKILVVAYDFVPIPSPQSIRWAYLARELDQEGHEVHVLAPDVAGYGAGGLPVLPSSVRVHRSFPGPLAGFIASRKRKAGGRASPAPGSGRAHAPASSVPGVPVETLNWKGRAFKRLTETMSWALFPDWRAEWLPWASRRLIELVETLSPEVVITSHEPAVSLRLGLLAKRRGMRWIADLGDPVLAPYTSSHHRSRAIALEEKACKEADAVTVTSMATLALLRHRHDGNPVRGRLVTQGFDSRRKIDADGDAPPPSTRLRLLYTGSLYSFRRLDDLIAAVIACNGVCLSVATSSAPLELVDAVREHPEAFEILGAVGHLEALDLQRKADVLVNIANRDPVQVPGKLYEYLGAGRPILHITSEGGADEGLDLLQRTGVGWSVPGRAADIATVLRELLATKFTMGCVERPSPRRDEIDLYSWNSGARRMAQLCEEVCRTSGEGDREPA